MSKITLVIGGSGSGKSEFAENLLETEKKKYYIATMRKYGDADFEKIARHKELRLGKNFETLEWEKRFIEKELEGSFDVIIECMGTFCANWLFDDGYEMSLTSIKKELEKVFEKANRVIVVSNDVFSDGGMYLEETTTYINLLSQINLWIANKADQVVEVVYSIPIYHKGGNHV